MGEILFLNSNRYRRVRIAGRPLNYNFLIIWFDPSMPRKARMDAPGASHHIIVGGIERRKIF